MTAFTRRFVETIKNIIALIASIAWLLLVAAGLLAAIYVVVACIKAFVALL